IRNSISGSEGLGAACDTQWNLKRTAGKADAELHITGRDVSEQCLALEFKEGFWNVLGDAETVKVSQERKAIVAALLRKTYPMTPKAIADATEKNISTIRTLIQRMTRDGLLIASTPHHYAPNRTHPIYISLLKEREREREGSTETVDGVDGVDGVD